MKIEGDVNCPNCKKDHLAVLDIDKLEMKSAKPPEILNPTTATQTNQILEEPKPKPEIKTVIEDFKPNYECPNGDCDIGVHKNTNYLYEYTFFL